MINAHVASPAMEEALALHDGLSLATGRGWEQYCGRIRLHGSDQACTGDQSWWNESDHVSADCVGMALNIGNACFKYCLWKANEVVHELARDSFANNFFFVIWCLRPLASCS